jgi:hypothetical protein
MQVEDRLPAPFADVDDDAVVLEARLARGLRDELEHSLCLLGRELADLAEAGDVPLRKNEQMGVGARIDVVQCDESFGRVDVVALADERAEQAVVRQREFPPP